MKNIVSSFQEIVNRMPNETAVVFEGKSWTYWELEQQSNSIAAFLTNRQMRGRQVGTAMKRGQEWIVALLGIWKAGAVYVPLDLNHPHKRLELIIADCEIALVICSRGESFKPHKTPVCYADEILLIGDRTQQQSLPEDNDRAYIIYTSGTSGKPKGIPACHWQAVEMSRINKEKSFYVNAGDRILQLAGLNFSASLAETLTALLNGVCLVVAGDKERHDPGLLVELIEREQVRSAIIPPALLAVFPKVSLEGLETIVVGGEGVAADVKDFWMKGRRMVNAYGFTESIVLVTAGVYTEDMPVNDVGTLLSDAMVYVLDEDLNPVPDGTPGEFCITGPQLTEGYWNRPELNERKFIRNPFLSDDGFKTECYLQLYRSGDKVTRLPNGHFLYGGRLDNQIKIRGMRIELSEVEQCLNHYPGVSLSVVLAKEYRARKVLIAYLQAEKEISREKITAFIAERLPDYMRPAYYVTLLNFPMNMNRKIDKNQLPEPDWEEKEWKEKPATPIEKEIGQIWHRLLGRVTVGRYDHFISLGGDSISVLLMTNALEETFGIRLKVEDIFSRLELHILAQFIEQSISEKAEDIGKIIHRSVYASSPLSRALRNLWSQCVSSQEMNEAYKLAFFLPWSKELKVELLQKAWNRIVEEQEVMRMSFPLDAGGEPQIQVSSFVYADIPVCDVTDNEFREKAHELYLRPFHLEEGPLHRVCLYRLPNGEYSLVIIIHHLVTDGWSVRVLNDKLHTYYQCAAQGIRFPIEDYSYRDYVMWNKEQFNEAIVEQRMFFWKQYLSNCPSLHFEGKRNSNVPAKRQGAAKYIPMDRRLVEQLENYCSHHGVTPLVACLSVFQLLLFKYTGQTDFAVGLAATDRKRLELQKILGYFVSLFPVRIIHHRNTGFDYYTRELMKEIVKLVGNSLPFDFILNSMERDIDRKQPSQLVRFTFGLEEVPSETPVPEEWITSSSFDMTLIIHKYEGNYSFHFQYATACFDKEFIVQFSKSFETALQYLLDEPSRNRLECPLLSTDEIAERISIFTFSERILPHWNVIERFEEIAARQPEGEAYCWADFRMNYRELNKMSDRVAAIIQEKFILRKVSSVGIFLKDKKYLLPAIMGVLKSGGCYVPLDVTLPIERLLFIMEDAALSLLLVDESYSLNLPCETLVISNLMEKESPVTFQATEQKPEDTAYIIYTSGSTGKPKGVPISHRSLALFVDGQSGIYQFQSGKRVLQYTNAGFDLSVMEIFPALTAGASLIIPTEEERKDCCLLLDLIEREKVYFAIIPPSLLSILPYRMLPDLRILVVGGESTPFDVMERWMQGRRFVNAYGPTENTVLTTCLEISEGFLSNDIGSPLPGVSCYVLDDHMTLLPDDVPGELYIGGLQLTAGYLNRKELNQEKFVNNPFVSPDHRKAGINTRLYKSGDKAMRTTQGHFLFMGRKDSQVKVHGFRIELEEIAKQLEACPGILQAIVLLKERGHEKRIAAYLLTGGTEEMKLEEVRKFLSNRLPFYMIPSAWAILKSFPLTVNGKVDRKALPEPELFIEEEYEPPLNREEEVLAKIAARLLRLSRMGVCTDLIDAGLSSLQIMELVRDAQEKNVSLSVTDVYKGRHIRNILTNREKTLFFWGNEPASDKPLIVLVCGYSSFKPFYDRFVERFKDHYSFFVFESFLEYFRNKNQFDARKLVNGYREVLKKKLEGREIYAVMGHCLGGELAMMLAEQLRTNGSPSIRLLIIEGFIRRDKKLLVPAPVGNELLQEQSRITNGIIESMPKLSFGGEMIVCLAAKPSTRFMFETDDSDSNDELIRAMWAATRKNWINWNNLYPQTIRYRLDADHWTVFDNDPLSALYEIVKRNWRINKSSYQEYEK